MRAIRGLSLGLVALLAACTRWANLPAQYSERGDIGVKVSEIPTAPGEYDMRAWMTNLIYFPGDPLGIKSALETASRVRAQQLCGQRKPDIVTVAQQPSSETELFTHVVCR